MDNCYQWWENELNQQYREIIMSQTNKQLTDDELEKLHNELISDIEEVFYAHTQTSGINVNLMLSSMFCIMGKILYNSDISIKTFEYLFDSLKDNILKLLKSREKDNE